MTATATTPGTTPADIASAHAGTPPEKVVDIATGGASTKPVNDNASGATPENPEKDKSGQANPGSEAAPPPAPPPAAEPSKLDKARAVARAKHEENQRRLIQQEQSRRAQAVAAQERQQLEAERARAQAATRELERLRDPAAALEHLERIGLSPKVLAEKAVAMNTPEARLQAFVAAQVAEATKAYEERFHAMEQERAQVQQAQRARAAEQEFLKDAANAESFPSVAQMMDLGDEWRSSILEEAKRVVYEAHRKTGIEYSNAEVLAYLDKKYQKIVGSQSRGGDQKSNGANAAHRDALNGTGANETQAAGSPRTLTNKTAQEKGSLPPDFDSLTPDQQNAALAALYRALRRT